MIHNDDQLFFEDEIDEDQTDDSIPERERRLVTQPFDFTVRSLVDQIDDKSITVDETWQRKYVWDDAKASRLIESLLLNVPIPVCYFAEEISEHYLVIDGQQRLWSIFRFLKNQFPLTGLKTLGHNNKKRFFELDEKDQKFIRSRTIRCIALTQESHPDLRFDVFERLNTGSVSLSRQELRHCMYRGDLNDLLKILCEDKSWLQCLNRQSSDNRLNDQELILRFFAFYYNNDIYKTPLYKFLNEFMRQNRKMNDSLKTELITLFNKTVKNVLIVFGGQAFRREKKDEGKTEIDKNINKALFDLEMYTCSRLSKSECEQKKDKILEAFKNLMLEDEFFDLITRSTDHRSRVFRRIELMQNKLSAQGINLERQEA